MVLPDILGPFGIKSHKDLAKILKCHEEHARKLWTGRRRLSIKAAERLKALTDGRYTMDFLLSLRADGGRG